MQYMGFTLNNITMLGLILAIGIVIDDAVVVHENIFRHMEEDGMDAMTAARIGTREIALPVLATSLSLIVIFVPLAYMGGIVGRFFSSFGLTVAFAVAMSLFVSFTLTPMLCSRFLKLEPGEAGARQEQGGFVWRLVDRLLRLDAAQGAAVEVPGRAADRRGHRQHRCRSPDHGDVVHPARRPERVRRHDHHARGLQPGAIRPAVRRVGGAAGELPGTVHLFTTIGQVAGGKAVEGQGDVTLGTVYVRMTELEDRDFSQFAVQDQARQFLKGYPDLRVSVNDVSAFQSGRRAQTFQVNLAGPDLGRLAVYAEELKARMSRERGLTDLDTTLSLRKPEVQVAIDRERASDLGIPVATIADTLRILVGGLPVSNFKSGGEQYDVWLRAAAVDRSSTKDLYQLTLPSPTAGLVKLTSVARLIEEHGPSEIERYGRQRIVTVLANPDPQVLPLGNAIERATEILEEMKLPPEYSFQFTGQAKTMGETGKYFLIAFGLSILFMYLILAAQFESWTQPVAILMALPVTIPFGLLSLVLFRTPMDIYAMFGLFMLVGIVKKNGILQVDSTNQLRAQGLNRHDAIVEANHTRLRPILMTTVMLVAAMVPIALGQGPGAGARASMAKVIIGGQMLSLVLALIVTPVFYALLDSWVGFTRRLGFRLSVAAAPRREPHPAAAAAKPESVQTLS
jgi:HAE1 family hydrophobic/amphiphilic exporter-1